MASSNKKEFELLMTGVDGGKRITARNSTHVLVAELLWPRVGVSQKSSAMTLELKGGKLEMRGDTWHKRILYKDSVEGRFALRVKVSESMTDAALSAFMRFMGSTLFGALETLTDNHFGGIAGDVFSAPFEYERKKLAKAADTEYILEGTVDLNAADLTDAQEIEVPLLAVKDVFAPTASSSTGSDHVHTRPTPRKLLYKKGERLGTATFTLNSL